MERWCGTCGKKFNSIRERDFICPACIDEMQKRPTVCVERKELNTYTAFLDFDIVWTRVENNPGDKPSWKYTLKGSEFGASWQGRIDIFAPEPIQRGAVVHIYEMEVTHRTEPRKLRENSEYDFRQEYEKEESGKMLFTRKYLRLEKTDMTESGNVFGRFEAHSKYTLKGYGKQFSEKIYGEPVAVWEVSGGSRNGRFSTVCWFAIISEESPVYIEHTENNYTEKECFSGKEEL